MGQERLNMCGQKRLSREMIRYFLILICTACLLIISGIQAHAMRISVSGAGVSAVNGFYSEAGVVNGKQSYVSGQYSIEWFNTGMVFIWCIKDVMSGNPLYGNNSESLQPAEAGWYPVTGTPPAPAMVLLSFQDVSVSGAGTSAANGTYKQIGLSNGKPRYSIGGGQSASYYLEWYYVMGYAWALLSNSGNQLYANFTDTPTPPANGWTMISGSSPAPTLPNIPKQLSYQGYLKDSANVPVNGPTSLTFKLYNMAADGAPLWSETQTVTVASGIYSVTLGAVTPFNLPFNEVYYLGVTVGVASELTPRQQLTSAPYALSAASVQDGVVTTGSYADPSWITSLSGSKITGNISGVASLAESSVTTTKIANGAVTDDKITGPISGNKLGSHTHTANEISDQIPDSSLSTNIARLDSTQAFSGSNTFSSPIVSSVLAGTAPFAITSNTLVTNLNADLLDGNHASTYMKKYAKVAIVSATNGDYLTPLAAMTAKASWCGTPSATNPCLIKVLPGVYSHGSSSLNMSPYIDIEGSGENVTYINGSVSAGTFGVINGSDNAEVRFLTVSNTVGRVISNSNASPKLTNITITGTSATSSIVGVLNSLANPKLTNVTIKLISVGGTGIYNVNNSSPEMSNIQIEINGGTGSTYGIQNNSSTGTISNVSISLVSTTGGSYGIDNVSSYPLIRSVKIMVASDADAAGIRCINNSGTFITDSFITGNGGSGGLGSGVGIVVVDSSPTIVNVHFGGAGYSAVGMEVVNGAPLINRSSVLAGGGSGGSTGLANFDGANPTIVNSRISSQSTGTAYGISNYNSSMVLQGSSVSAYNGTTNVGLSNVSDGPSEAVSIEQSSIEGSIISTTGYKLKIGASKIGTIDGAGTYNCVNSYRDDGTDFVAVGTGCLPLP